MGFQSFGWHLYGQRKEGQKSALSGLLGSSFSARLARTARTVVAGETFSEPESARLLAWPEGAVHRVLGRFPSPHDSSFRNHRWR